MPDHLAQVDTGSEIARLHGLTVAEAHIRNDSEQCAQRESGPIAAELPELIGFRPGLPIQLLLLYTICIQMSITFRLGLPLADGKGRTPH